MPAINQQQFLQAIEAKTEKVLLPDLGPDVYAVIRSLDAPGLLDMQRRFGKGIKSSNEENAARLLLHCLVDDDGNRLFDPADPDAEAKVKRAVEGKGYLLAKLSDVALRLSGLPLAQEEAGVPEKN